jgi:hypothetical protein
MLKNLKNKDKAFLQEDIYTVRGTLIPAGTKIRVANMLNVTAVIDILPYELSPHTKFPLYRRVLIKSLNMNAEVKRAR